MLCCVHVSTHVYTHMCIHTCGDERIISGFSPSTICFLGTELTWSDLEQAPQPAKPFF